MSFKAFIAFFLFLLSLVGIMFVAMDGNSMMQRVLALDVREMMGKIKDKISDKKPLDLKVANLLDKKTASKEAELSSYCIRPAVGVNACANDGDGSSWSCATSPNGRGAFKGLPSKMKRGSTYYVGDGRYDWHILRESESGSQLITIKKAILTDHGANADWDNALGTGQSIFQGFKITTGYWILDGQRRNDDWKSGYGFAIDTSEKGGPGIYVGNTYSASHITIKYLEVIGGGDDNDKGGNNLICAGGIPGTTGWKIQYCYLHDAGGTPIQIIHNNNVLIEYCYIARNESHPKEHSEGIMAHDQNDSWIVRFNIWEDIEGTAVIAFVGDNWEIYGNVFYHTESNNPKVRKRWGVGNGTIATFTGRICNNTKIYNNTFANMRGHNNGIYFSSGQKNVAFNNLWYSCNHVEFANVDHDYNWFFKSGTQSEPNIQKGTENPFINEANNNFRLSKSTSPGKNDLGALYNTDIDGKIRGADGVWDRGAFEYSAEK
ncbi:MAG: right-handed parallel beta-helix repeat-containing protein [Proteobacteria bacterium]|nr:right-handed parallel beta-helix repeat-containing protein [Pseudomonadota bacterium]